MAMDHDRYASADTGRRTGQRNGDGRNAGTDARAHIHHRTRGR
jgi:hypothetical protein